MKGWGGVLELRVWSWVLVCSGRWVGGGSSLRTHGLLNLCILQCTPVVVSEDHCLSLDACRHRRCPLSRSPSVSGAIMPQPWGLLSSHSSGMVSRTSSPSYREDSLVHWGARGATALCTSQLCDNRQKLLVQQIKKQSLLRRHQNTNLL